MKIIIGADIFVTESNLRLFESGNIEELVGSDLNKILRNADFRIFNLEGPITESNSPIEKCGPNLKMPANVINGIAALNPSLLTLANNHIMDYGKTGYEDTVKLLSSRGINYVGTGDNIATLKKSYCFEKDDIKIGVYSCAEHEFSIAKNNYPGANPYDPLNTFDDILNLKQQCDFVVVLYHGGKECYRYPSPELQRCFRKMADKGADLVVAQHTHCVGCKEEFKNSTLIYGQGNFIFDDGDDEYWNSGLLINLEINKNFESQNIEKQISYIPYQKNQNGMIRIANNEIKDEVLNGFFYRSKEIEQDGVVESKFRAFSDDLFLMYLSSLHGDNYLFRFIKKVFGINIVKKLYSKKSLLDIQNFIECECHREVLLNNLRNY